MRSAPRSTQITEFRMLYSIWLSASPGGRGNISSESAAFSIFKVGIEFVFKGLAHEIFCIRVFGHQTALPRPVNDVLESISIFCMIFALSYSHLLLKFAVRCPRHLIVVFSVSIYPSGPPYCCMESSTQSKNKSNYKHYRTLQKRIFKRKIFEFVPITPRKIGKNRNGPRTSPLGSGGTHDGKKSEWKNLVRRSLQYR